MTVDLALAKQHCRVCHDDEDTIIAQYLADAIAMVERLSGTLLTRREITQTFDAFDDRLPLYWGPDPDTVTVSYTDEELAPQEITDAIIVRHWLYAPSVGWPTPATDTPITVTYRAGWTDVPADLDGAVLVLVAGKYDQREGAWDDAQRAARDICSRIRLDGV